MEGVARLAPSRCHDSTSTIENVLEEYEQDIPGSSYEYEAPVQMIETSGQDVLALEMNHDMGYLDTREFGKASSDYSLSSQPYQDGFEEMSGGMYDVMSSGSMYGIDNSEPDQSSQKDNYSEPKRYTLDKYDEKYEQKYEEPQSQSQQQQQQNLLTQLPPQKFSVVSNNRFVEHTLVTIQTTQLPPQQQHNGTQLSQQQHHMQQQSHHKRYDPVILQHQQQMIRHAPVTYPVKTADPATCTQYAPVRTTVSQVYTTRPVPTTPRRTNHRSVSKKEPLDPKGVEEEVARNVSQILSMTKQNRAAMEANARAGIAPASQPKLTYSCQDCQKTVSAVNAVSSTRNLQRHRQSCPAAKKLFAPSTPVPPAQPPPPSATITSQPLPQMSTFGQQEIILPSVEDHAYSEWSRSSSVASIPMTPLREERNPSFSQNAPMNQPPSAINNDLDADILFEGHTDLSQLDPTTFSVSSHLLDDPSCMQPLSLDVDDCEQNGRESGSASMGSASSQQQSFTYSCEACKKSVSSFRSLKRHHTTCKQYAQEFPHLLEQDPSKPVVSSRARHGSGSAKRAKLMIPSNQASSIANSSSSPQTFSATPILAAALSAPPIATVLKPTLESPPTGSSLEMHPGGDLYRFKVITTLEEERHSNYSQSIIAQAGQRWSSYTEDTPAPTSSEMTSPFGQTAVWSYQHHPMNFTYPQNSFMSINGEKTPTYEVNGDHISHSPIRKGFSPLIKVRSSSRAFPLSHIESPQPTTTDDEPSSGHDEERIQSPDSSSCGYSSSGAVPSVNTTCEDCNRQLCSASNLKRHRATCKMAIQRQEANQNRNILNGQRITLVDVIPVKNVQVQWCNPPEVSEQQMADKGYASSLSSQSDSRQMALSLPQPPIPQSAGPQTTYILADPNMQHNKPWITVGEHLRAQHVQQKMTLQSPDEQQDPNGSTISGCNGDSNGQIYIRTQSNDNYVQHSVPPTPTVQHQQSFDQPRSAPPTVLSAPVQLSGPCGGAQRSLSHSNMEYSQPQPSQSQNTYAPLDDHVGYQDYGSTTDMSDQDSFSDGDFEQLDDNHNRNQNLNHNFSHEHHNNIHHASNGALRAALEQSDSRPEKSENGHTSVIITTEPLPEDRLMTYETQPLSHMDEQNDCEIINRSGEMVNRSGDVIRSQNVQPMQMYTTILTPNQQNYGQPQDMMNVTAATAGKEVDLRFQCPECLKTYSCRKNVKRHRMAVHKLTAEDIARNPAPGDLPQSNHHHHHHHHHHYEKRESEGPPPTIHYSSMIPQQLSRQSSMSDGWNKWNREGIDEDESAETARIAAELKREVESGLLETKKAVAELAEADTTFHEELDEVSSPMRYQDPEEDVWRSTSNRHPPVMASRPDPPPTKIIVSHVCSDCNRTLSSDYSLKRHRLTCPELAKANEGKKDSTESCDSPAPQCDPMIGHATTLAPHHQTPSPRPPITVGTLSSIGNGSWGDGRDGLRDDAPDSTTNQIRMDTGSPGFMSTSPDLLRHKRLPSRGPYDSSEPVSKMSRHSCQFQTCGKFYSSEWNLDSHKRDCCSLKGKRDHRHSHSDPQGSEDTVIIVGSVKFAVSKLALSRSSSYFSSLFLFQDQSKAELRVDVDPNEFQMLLDAHNNPFSITAANIDVVSALADKLKFNTVYEHCEKFIAEKLPQISVMHAIRLAEQLKLTTIKQKLFDSISIDVFRSLSADQDYRLMGADLKAELLEKWGTFL